MRSLSTIQKAFIALIIANIIWGAAAPIFKFSLQNIPPFTLAFWRFFLAIFILLPLAWKHMDLKLASRQDAILLFCYGFFGITVNILFFFWGLQRTYAINSPIITSGQPIMTLLFAMLFLREKFFVNKFIGMLLGTLGILVIVIEPLLLGGVNGSILGNMFLVVATIAAVGQTIVGKKIINKYDPWAFTVWAFIIGSASFLPLAVYEFIHIPNLYPSISFQGYFGIGYGALFSSAAGYGLFGWGLSKITATDASLFSYVDPVVGTIVAFFLLHEPITAPFVLGATLIFGGIFIAEGRLNYHPIRKIIALGQTIIDEIPHKKISKKAVLASIFKR